MHTYNAAAWFWTGQPAGQSAPVIYSSAKGALIAADDSAFAAWSESGGLASPWPRDEDGAETSEALDAVLAAAGLPPTGLSAPTPAQLLAYASARQNTALAQVFTFNVAASGAAAHEVTTTLDAAGSASVAEIAVWIALNAATTPPPSMPYNNDDGTATTLTYAEALALATQAGALKMSTYALLNTLCAGILASPPTISATAQIGAAAWPAPGTSGA